MYADDFDEKEKARIESKGTEPNKSEVTESEESSKFYLKSSMDNFFFFIPWFMIKKIFNLIRNFNVGVQS